MNTILLTGGAGFIGSNFVRHLVDAGAYRVVNLDKLTYAGNLDSLELVCRSPLHVFVEGDICDATIVHSLLEEYKPSAIVNLAAESHVDRSIDGPAQFIHTNIVGTFELLETARNFWERLPRAEQDRFRFLHVSTDEVYGSLGPAGSFTEETRYAPNSPYSASKAAADHLVRAYHRTYDLPTIITNSSNNYGPYQFPEKLIPLMIQNALEGEPLPVYGDGGNVRDWLFVDDHCEALARVLEHGLPGQQYNIGGSAERTNLEVVRTISGIVERLCPDRPYLCESLITLVEDRPGHDRRYAIDAGKIRRELGWRPKHDFASGLEATVRWYLDNQQWVERVTSGVHQRQRVGLSQSSR